MLAARKLFFYLSILCSSMNSHAQSPDPHPTNPKNIPEIPVPVNWWKEAIIYQIYPRSFMDQNGDGIGDLKGIISKLDYLKSLGITAIWLNPIYQSPNYDNGYDVSDYNKILDQFGTMEDFDALLKGLHERNIRCVMDIVVNHSSSEHPWFLASKSSRTNKYRDYYHWWNAERGKPTPRYSFFDVNHDAWKFDSLTNAYYLHIFAEQQPDLNWENPAVRQDIYAMMKFWLDKGVDGLRMDAFQFIAKDTTFPTFPEGYDKDIQAWYGNGPHLHDYIQEMNREVLSKYDVMSVSEGAGKTPADAMKFVDPDRHEFSMAYHFEGIDYGKFDPEYDLRGFKEVYTRWDKGFEDKGWLAIFLANHDQPRMVSHWGNDNPEFRAVSAKMLTTFLMTMRGTPYFYYGDELGMTNIRFNRIEDYRDIETRNKYQHLEQTGGDVKAFLKTMQTVSRDNSRTPFQWDAGANAGFTKGTPWINVNENYKTVNAAAEENDPGSVLNYFRKVVQLRKDNQILVYGKYELLDKSNPDVYTYTRTLNGKTWLVMLNFKSRPAKANTGIDLTKAKWILGNYDAQPKGKMLRAYEVVIYQL